MDRSRSGGVLDPAVSGGEPHSPWPTALDGRRQPKPSPSAPSSKPCCDLALVSAAVELRTAKE